MRNKVEFGRFGQTYSVPMVLKLFDVLKAFRLAGPRLALTQVIGLCNISKASAFRILETLRSEGYVTKDAHGSYRLTYQLLELAMVVKDRNPLRKAALPYLGQLNREFQETVNLGALEDDHVVYVDVLESPHRLRIVPTVGSRLPLHATALGKAVAAFLPRHELMPMFVRDGLKRFTPNTITDLGSLLRELSKTVECGYAIDREEETLQCICIAAPVFDSKSRVVGAISVSGPSSRMSSSRVHQIGLRSIETARIISDLLGFQAGAAGARSGPEGA
jgi:IclR family acetate operon transcriptional repressor